MGSSRGYSYYSQLVILILLPIYSENDTEKNPQATHYMRLHIRVDYKPHFCCR